jgi:hypothetical protein
MTDERLDSLMPEAPTVLVKRRICDLARCMAVEAIGSRSSANLRFSYLSTFA